MDDLDINDFVVKQVPAGRPKQHRPRPLRSGEWFIPGPVPLQLLRFFRLPAAFRVWIALHMRQRMGYTQRLARNFMSKLGLSKRDAQRGLAELERLGLARVERQRGRAAIVELLPLPEPTKPTTSVQFEQHQPDVPWQ